MQKTLVLSIVAVGLLAGCGGGSSSTVPASPAAAVAVATQPRAVKAVASVAGTPISQASYAHWVAVDTRLVAIGNTGHQALGFLLTSQWVLEEAASRGISVSEAQVKSRLAQLVKQSYPKPGELQKFLSKSGETEADLLARARVELLKARIAAKVTAGKSVSQAKSLLASFQQAFHNHWKLDTMCRPAYVMDDCSEYRGKEGKNLAATAPHPFSGSGSSSKPSSSHSAPRRSASPQPTSPARSPGSSKVNPKEVPPGLMPELPPRAAGTMALSSPAFELNGLIPTQYTCDGAGISPPLEWTNVPAHAAELILFVVDEGTQIPAGGLRWIVADINPKSKGVAAGQIPEGGVVGSDSEGKSAYGSICPAHGKITRVVFTMYALSKKTPLSTGFQPNTAEYESYGPHNKWMIGRAAVTYAAYKRH